MEEDATLGRIGGFRLIKRLATGGTSDVLLARAEGPHGFERTVVLKRLLTEHQNDPDFARMFTREAAAYARLSHPAIVRLFDFFTASGQLVMVLEYVDGLSLARLMTHAAQTNQKLDDRICFFLAARVFDALSAAHDAHNPDTGEPTPVIHRDVNPSNVLIPWDGHAKLADFGIAKIQGSGEAETSQGLIKGTYGYMAPEQVRGERVTIRTDVYAATLVLWELLARRKAIQADKLPEMEILRAMAEPNLPKLDVMRPDIHESVREAVVRGLEPNPAKRAMTAEEMMGILRAHFDPDDARQRLEKVLAPLKAVDSSRSGKQASLSDTITEDLRETSQSPAMTLPIATPRPRVPPRPPPPRPSTAATAVAVIPAELLRTTTPSGFRPVPAQQTQLQAQTLPIAPPNTPPMREPSISKPTLAGGFAPLAMPPQLSAPPPAPSEAPTLQTKAVDPAQVSFASSGAIPIHHASQSWAPTPPPAFPNHSPQPQHAMLPIVPQQQPRRSYGVVIIVAILAGLFVVGAVGGVLVYMRGGASAFSLPTTETATASTTVTTTTATATITATATATATATSMVTATTSATTPIASTSATATATASASASTTATVASTAPPSDTPKPGPDEGVLILPASAQGHRIYIDGKVKGEGTAPLVISCGQHAVQIGSAGKSRDVNVPCGALARIEP